jgi:hypothetical protein
VSGPLYSRVKRLKEVPFEQAVRAVLAGQSLELAELPAWLRCPIHGPERTPSLIVHEGYWYCHGACFPAGTLVWTSDGQRPIETLRIGDLVFTHEGRFRRVTQTWGRRYTGAMIELGIRGLPSVTTTADHEILTVRGQVRSGSPSRSRWPGGKSEQPDPPYRSEFVRADRLRAGDFVFMPVPAGGESRTLVYERARWEKRKGPRCRPIPSEYSLGEDLAWLIGLYVAEGNANRGLIFSLHLREINIAEKVGEIVRRIFGLETRHYSHEKNGRLSRTAFVPHAGLGRWFAELCGSGAANKRFPVDVFLSDRRVHAAALAGYLVGDGCRGQTRGMITAASVSPSIAFAIPVLAARGRWRSSCITFEEASATPRRRPTWKSHTSRMRPRRTFEDRLAYPLRSVEVVRQVEDLEVFDLEVEEDHSYVVGGIAVSNCKTGGDALDLVQALEGLELREGVARLEQILGISEDPAAAALARALAENRSSPEVARGAWAAVVEEIADEFLSRIRMYACSPDPLAAGIAEGPVDWVLEELRDAGVAPPPVVSRARRELLRDLRLWSAGIAEGVERDVLRATGRDRLDVALLSRATLVRDLRAALEAARPLREAWNARQDRLKRERKPPRPKQ